MKLKKLEACFCIVIVVIGIVSAIFFSLFLVTMLFLLVGAIASLTYFMTPQYYFAVALREFELEEAIINVLRSAGAITGRKDDWIAMKQVLEEVAKKLRSEDNVDVECWVAISSLVRKKIVEVGSVSGNVRETFCRLVDKSYRPKKPNNSIEAKESRRNLCTS